MSKCHSHINTSRIAITNLLQTEKVTQRDSTPYCCSGVLCANWVGLAQGLCAVY